MEYKSPLHWVGSKGWLAPRLKEMYEPHKHLIWVEPFCGGLGATLGVMPEIAYLMDTNFWLINFWLEAQKGFHSAKIPNTKEDYNEVRSYFNRNKDNLYLNVSMAQAFYYLNKHGYCGLMRYNKKGEFNTPWGGRNNPVYEEYVQLPPETKNWTFIHGDALALKEMSSFSTFLYADPPYFNKFTRYDAINGLGTVAGQFKLAETLSRHKGPVVISNSPDPRVIGMYREFGFRVEIINKRHSTFKGNNKSNEAAELLAWKGL